MAKLLKQSTAVDVKIGPFIDDTDGKTAETALTTAYTSIYLFKNGSTSVNKNETTAIAHDAIGFYLVKLNATDTNTLGILKIATHVAGHLSVWDDFMVVPANVYDSLVGGTDALDVSAIQLAGQTITAAAGVTFPTSVASPTNITAAAGCAVSSIGANVITAASINADAITAAKIADGAIDAATFAAGAINAAAIADNAIKNATFAADVGSTALATNMIAKAAEKAVGVAGAGLTAIGDTRMGNLDGFITDIPTQIRLELATELSNLDATVSSRLATSGYTAPLDAAGTRTAIGLATANLDTQLGAIDDYLDTEVAAIKAKTDLIPASPASTTNITAASGIAVSSIGANVITATSIAANAITSAKIATDAIGAAQIAADAVAEIVDANWDEALVGHGTVGSAGERLDNLYTVYLAGGSDGTVVANNALDAAGVRAAVGLASANLDTQLTAIDDAIDTEVAAIKAKTDLIPAAPAAVGDIPSAATIASQVRTELTTELGRIDAAISTRSTYAGTDTAGVTTLLSRIASALTITGGAVNVNDKTGFSLSGAGVQAIWDALTSALTTVGSIGKRLSDYVDVAISSRSSYAGGDTAGVTTLLSRIIGTLAAGTHNAQTGDSFARLGAAGAGLTAIGDTRMANLDATVSSRLATAGYTVPPSAAANASQVRTELTTELGRIDATVSSRLATAGYTAPPTVGQIADANWDEALIGHLTAGTAGKALSDAGAAGTPLDAAGVRAALGMATNNLDAQLAAVPTATENADALLDRTNAIDVGLTPRHALELAAASVLQKLSGAGTGTERVRNFSDTADLATVTVDGSGNKNAIIYDFSI